LPNCERKIGRGAVDVGIIKTKEKLSFRLMSEQPVYERDSRVSDVK